MPVSTIQRTTEQHAQRVYEQAAVREIGPGTAAGVIFVGELDGSMVPVMEPSPEVQPRVGFANIAKHASDIAILDQSWRMRSGLL